MDLANWPVSPFICNAVIRAAEGEMLFTPHLFLSLYAFFFLSFLSFAEILQLKSLSGEFRLISP